MATKTPKEIMSSLPYEMPNGWVIHQINGNRCMVECPKCKTISDKLFYPVLYGRPKNCIKCANKAKRKEHVSNQNTQVFSLTLDSNLIARFREKVESENKFVTHVITQMIENYLENGL